MDDKRDSDRPESAHEARQGSSSEIPVTVLFTDIVGSTRLFRERGDGAAHALLATLNHLLLSTLKRHEGSLIKTIGDSMMVTFDRPRKALGCALEMQRELAERNEAVPPADRLHIRIGIEHGTAIVEPGEVYGGVVKRAECIEGKASGGEIFTSLETWQMSEHLDTEIERLGEFDLKGFSDKATLVKVLWNEAEIAEIRKRNLEGNLLPEMARAILLGKCILVLGGLTNGPNKPSVNQRVAARLLKKMGSADRRRDLAQVASLLEQHSDREEVLQAVAEELRQESEQPSALLSALVEIPFRVILTTALDAGLEILLARAGRKVKKVQKLAEVNLAELEQGEVALIKLLGDLDEPASLSLTEEEADERIAKLEQASEDLRAALNTHRLLFLGFRWNDVSFKRLFSRLTPDRIPEECSAIGLSCKLPVGAQASWRRRGLLLAQMNEQKATEKLQEALGEATRVLKKKIARESSLQVRSNQGLLVKRPYKFLSYFQEEDEDIFFGRLQETRKLYSLVVSHRLVILHAPSGTGKTSLINAGLTPMLKREGFAVVPERILNDPTQDLIERVRRYVAEESGQELACPSSLGSSSLLECLTAAYQVLEKPMIIMLDQFEEFFLRFPAKVRKTFKENLKAVTRERKINVRFLLSLRADFHSRLAEFKPYVPEVFFNDFRLDNLTEEGKALAIEGPAKLSGLSYEEGLVKMILDDLGAVGAETPQLQIICDRLYDELPPGELVFTLDQYSRLGGAKGILGSYLDRFIGSRSGDDRRIFRQVLKALVSSVGTKAVVTPKRVALETGHTLKAVEETLTSLLEARLIQKLSDGITASYELNHEYLIEEISSWIDENELYLKRARELLSQEMNNHEKMGLLMAPAQAAIIGKVADSLHLSREEEELLNKSQRSQRKRFHWFVSAMAAVTVAILVCALGLFWYFHKQVCASPAFSLAGVWDGERKGSVRRKVLVGNPAAAEPLWGRLSGVLDGYAASWEGMARRSCQETRVQGVQSEELFEMRSQCLNQRALELSELLGILLSSTGPGLERVLSAAFRLAPLSDCSGTSLVAPVGKIPKTGINEKFVSETRSKMGRAKILGDLGLSAEGLKMAMEALRSARSAGLFWIEAEVLFRLGVLCQKSGDLAGSEQWLNDATDKAMEVGDADLEARAEGQLVYLLGALQNRYDESLRLGKHAMALLRRSSGPVESSAVWPHLATLYGALAAVYQNKGELERAAEHYLRALSLQEKAYGPEHPLTAEIWVALGQLVTQKKDHALAVNHFQRALSIQEKILGPEHEESVASRQLLAEAYLHLGQPEQAGPLLEEVVSICQQRCPALSARSLFVQAGEALRQDSQRGQAMSLALRAKEIYHRLDRKKELREVEEWLDQQKKR